MFKCAGHSIIRRKNIFSLAMKTHEPEIPENSALIRELKSGSVLLSMDKLKDPNFKLSVVLICVKNADGAYGLILNRPSHMPLSEMFDGFNGVNTKKKVYIGGPVKQEELQIIQVTDSPVKMAYSIVPGVHLGGHWNDLGIVLENEDISSRLFLGYSGWGPGQLELEIIAGAWKVYSLDIKTLLTGPEEKLLTSFDEIENYLETLKQTE